MRKLRLASLLAGGAVAGFVAGTFARTLYVINRETTNAAYALNREINHYIGRVFQAATGEKVEGLRVYGTSSGTTVVQQTMDTVQLPAPSYYHADLSHVIEDTNIVIVEVQTHDWLFDKMTVGALKTAGLTDIQALGNGTYVSQLRVRLRSPRKGITEVTLPEADTPGGSTLGGRHAGDRAQD